MKKTIFLLISFSFLILTFNIAPALAMPPIYEHVTKETILSAILESVNAAFLDGEDLDEEAASTCSLDPDQKEVVRLMLDHESIFDTNFFVDEDFYLPGFIINIREQIAGLNTFENELYPLFEMSDDSFILAAQNFLKDKMPGNEDAQGRLSFALALVLIDHRFYNAF